MRFLAWLLANAAGLAVAAWLLDGISFDGADWQDKLVPLLVVALILGVVSAVVEPVVKLLSLPFIILTIGLFLLVINAWMLMIAGWVAGQADVGFEVDGFWTALVGGIVITLVTGLVNVAVVQED